MGFPLRGESHVGVSRQMKRGEPRPVVVELFSQRIQIRAGGGSFLRGRTASIRLQGVDFLSQRLLLLEELVVFLARYRTARISRRLRDRAIRGKRQRRRDEQDRSSHERPPFPSALWSERR